MTPWTCKLSVLIDSSISFVAPVRSESKHFHSMVELESESYQFSTIHTTISLSHCHLSRLNHCSSFLSAFLVLPLCPYSCWRLGHLCPSSVKNSLNSWSWSVPPPLKILPESHSHTVLQPTSFKVQEGFDHHSSSQTSLLPLSPVSLHFSHPGLLAVSQHTKYKPASGA